MANRQRTAAGIAGAREAAALAATLGGQIREGRNRRRMTLSGLARRTGLSVSWLAAIERGQGGGVPLGTWVAVGLAVGRPLVVTLTRPLSDRNPSGPADGGHLAIQELLLAFAATSGLTATFELPTRPADPTRSVDVCLRDDRHRCLVLAEAWNDFRDVGAATRSFRRKLAEAEALATAIGATPRYRVTGCWVIRSSASNRSLLAAYPHVFDSVLPGSSAGWVHALTDGAAPPRAPGIVWCDPAIGRLFARRRVNVAADGRGG